MSEETKPTEEQTEEEQATEESSDNTNESEEEIIIEETPEETQTQTWHERRKAKNEHNIDANAENLRAAATIGQKVPHPVVQGISRGVLIADNASGGRSTRYLGKKLNQANKIVPEGRKMQRRLNRLYDSGAASAVSKYGGKFGKNSSSKNSGGSGKVKIRSQSSKKKPNYILIIIIAAFAILSIIVVLLFSKDQSNAAGGTFALSQECRTVTVTDTENHIYDGEVDLEDYIAGVVAAEVGSANDLEYYKVAAIAARTYFLTHTSDSCTVEGNQTFQAYIDVEDHPNKDLIKQAVEETKGLVLIKDNDMAETYYASACVVNADNDYYYVRYGSLTLDEIQIQKIPKEWDSQSVFRGYLAEWYSYVDQNDTDYLNKDCPNNHDYGMSQIGALYLITEEDYDYQDVFNYYYGDVEIANTNSMAISAEVNGFINPVNNSSCSNGYGCRYHPIYSYYRMHNGIDLSASSGEPVYAAKDGIVTHITDNVPGYSDDQQSGNYIIITHDDGSETKYLHLLYGSIVDSIYVGATVEQGEMIAQVGSTGASTGPHLHYEIHINGQAVNPYDYLDLENLGNTNQCNSNADVPMSYCGY